MSLLWELYHHLHSTSKRMQARFGVTGPQRFAIRVLGLAPGLSAGELARTLHLHPSTLTGVLRRLEERGILRRTAHPRDGRRAVLRLTSHGRSKDGFRSGTVEHAVVAALAHTSPDDLAAARRVLRQLVVSLAEEVPREDASPAPVAPRGA